MKLRSMLSSSLPCYSSLLGKAGILYFVTQ